MELALEERGDVDVLAVRGGVHAEDNASFADALDGLRKRERFRVVIDGTGLEYLNSRAVGTLVAFSRDARICGGRVAIVDPNPTVRKILKAVGLFSLLPSYDNLEKAVAACCGGRPGG